MCEVLEIHEVRFDASDLLVVEAVVSDMVLTHAASRLDPPEWGPALCRGTMLLCEEDLIPASEYEFKKLLTSRVLDWAPLDQSDLYE
jgi:hypothetical protein